MSDSNEEIISNENSNSASYVIPEEKLRKHHISILESVENDTSLKNHKKFAKKLGISPSTLSYHMKNLCGNDNSGYIKINNDGYNNFYRLTERGRNVLRSISQSSTFQVNDRAHDLMYNFPIKHAPFDWLNDTRFIERDMKNWRQYTLNKNNVVIRVNGQSSITVVIKEFRCVNAEVAVTKAYFAAVDEVQELIRLHKGLLIGSDGDGFVCLSRINKQSHAVVGDPYAEMMYKIKSHVKGKETGGVFEVDASYGRPEVEFVDPKMSHEQHKEYALIIGDMVTGKIRREALSYLSDNLDKIKSIIERDKDEV